MSSVDSVDFILKDFVYFLKTKLIVLSQLTGCYRLESHLSSKLKGQTIKKKKNKTKTKTNTQPPSPLPALLASVPSKPYVAKLAQHFGKLAQQT